MTSSIVLNVTGEVDLVDGVPMTLYFEKAGLRELFPGTYFSPSDRVTVDEIKSTKLEPSWLSAWLDRTQALQSDVE